jgi:hypothetical protein
MSALPAARTTARDLLKTLTGDAAPQWRTCFSTNGTDEPTGIAPECPDEDHEDEDNADVYSCCPEPVIECHSYVMAQYLEQLLNADRGQS